VSFTWERWLIRVLVVGKNRASIEQVRVNFKNGPLVNTGKCADGQTRVVSQ
jgi:hypothetical protein